MLRLLTITTLLLALALPAAAKPKYRIPDTTENHVTARQEQFSAAERNIIRAYLQQKTVRQPEAAGPGLPPGLQKKVARGKQLPPGWQKKLARGRTLDYQVYRQGEELPEELLKRLPAPPGSKILRIDTANRAILDLFDLIKN